MKTQCSVYYFLHSVFTCHYLRIQNSKFISRTSISNFHLYFGIFYTQNLAFLIYKCLIVTLINLLTLHKNEDNLIQVQSQIQYSLLRVYPFCLFLLIFKFIILKLVNIRFSKIKIKNFILVFLFGKNILEMFIFLFCIICHSLSNCVCFTHKKWIELYMFW